MYHVNDICNDELELDGIITALMLFPPVSQMFSYIYTLYAMYYCSCCCFIIRFALVIVVVGLGSYYNKVLEAI